MKYIIAKNNEVWFSNFTPLKGYNFKPNNKIKYEGILVNTIEVLDDRLICKIIKRKNKYKIEKYLNYIMNIDESDSDEDPGDSLRSVLNEITRYKSIIRNKYSKYLDEKYMKLLLKKVALLEYEVNSKIYLYQSEYEQDYEEKVEGRGR
jgi:hypothetical protein